MDPSKLRLGKELSVLGLDNELQRSLSAMNAFQAELESITTTVVSPDRQIKLTVGVHGDVRELEFDPDIFQNQDPQSLAAAILATLTEASTAIAGKISARYDEFVEQLS